MMCLSLSDSSGYVPGPVPIVFPEGVLCEARRGASFIGLPALFDPLARASLWPHVVAAMTLHGFVLTVYGSALVAHEPYWAVGALLAIPGPANPPNLAVHASNPW
jgi:hypothetical protein